MHAFGLGCDAVDGQAVHDGVQEQGEAIRFPVGSDVSRDCVGYAVHQRFIHLAVQLHVMLQGIGKHAVDLEEEGPSCAFFKPDGVLCVQSVAGQRLGDVVQRPLKCGLQEDLPIEAVLQVLERVALLAKPRGSRCEIATGCEEVAFEQFFEDTVLGQVLGRARLGIPVDPAKHLGTVHREADIVGSQLAAVVVDERELGCDDLRLGVSVERVEATSDALGVQHVIRIEQGDVRCVDRIERLQD